LGYPTVIPKDPLITGEDIDAQTINTFDRWLPLQGLSYDPKGDEFEVMVENVDHLIFHPQDIYVDQEGLNLKSLEVVQRDGVKQIITLKDPLAFNVIRLLFS
jgi:hypothetical protein